MQNSTALTWYTHKFLLILLLLSLLIHTQCVHPSLVWWWTFLWRARQNQPLQVSLRALQYPKCVCVWGGALTSWHQSAHQAVIRCLHFPSFHQLKPEERDEPLLHSSFRQREPLHLFPKSVSTCVPSVAVTPSPSKIRPQLKKCNLHMPDGWHGGAPATLNY